MKKVLCKLIGTKEFYIKVLIIAVPVMLQTGITNFVGMIDNLMVGQIGTDQMSGVAIVNQLMFVFNIFIFGGVSGAGIFSAQFFGRNDQKGVADAFRFKTIVCTLITALGICLGAFFGRELISLYLHESGSGVGSVENTLYYGKVYLEIMLFGLVPFSINQIYTGTLRDCGRTVIPMAAGISAVVINLILDYVLIFGHFGAPAMGIEGAAIATCVARVIECAVVVIWTHMHKKENPYVVGLYKTFLIPKKLAKDMIIKGTPLMLNEMFWVMGMAVINQCYSYRGLEMVAAQNITSTISNVFNIVFFALGSSVAIVVGQLLGAGKQKEAREADTQLIAFSVTSAVVMGILMATFADWFPRLYNTEEAVKILASVLIRVTALIMPLQAFSHATYFTLRSGGRTGITFIFDSFYTWIFVVPLAFILSKGTSISVVWLFFIVQASEIVKCIIGFILVKRGNWMKTII